jgi:hypothetical protein
MAGMAFAGVGKANLEGKVLLGAKCCCHTYLNTLEAFFWVYLTLLSCHDIM